MAMSLQLNGKQVEVEAEAGTPLLWVIRDELKLTGTKFGCGVAYPKPSPDEIDDYMNGNACRCATYQRIRAGILRAAEILEA